MFSNKMSRRPLQMNTEMEIETTYIWFLLWNLKLSKEKNCRYTPRPRMRSHLEPITRDLMIYRYNCSTLTNKDLENE